MSLRRQMRYRRQSQGYGLEIKPGVTLASLVARGEAIMEERRRFNVHGSIEVSVPDGEVTIRDASGNVVHTTTK